MASRKRQKYGSKTENLLVIKLDEMQGNSGQTEIMLCI